MPFTRRACVLFFSTVAVAGCGGAGKPLPEVRGGIEIAMQRGSAWSTYTVKPPHIIGPRGTLQLRKGRLSGVISGRQVNLLIDQEQISGQAGGQVQIDIAGGPDQVDMEGLWNGTRLHMQVTPSSLRGTINAIEANTNTYVSVASGRFQCQYVLDKTDEDGSRVGSSICFGLPEPTRVEFPAQLQAWFTRNEQMAVLLALLASPPVSTFEAQSPIQESGDPRDFTR